MDEINNSDGEVVADYQTGRVVELHLRPEVAREFALSLTAASISVEEHARP